MTDNRTVKHNRAQMRGKPLSKDCYRANVSYHEYMPDGHDFTGCYGLMDWPENVNEECIECGAYVHGEFEKRAKEVMGARPAAVLPQVRSKGGELMGVKKGICSTCRFYKQDKLGRYCEQNVTGRMRGPNHEPCGWWRKRKAVNRC